MCAEYFPVRFPLSSPDVYGWQEIARDLNHDNCCVQALHVNRACTGPECGVMSKGVQTICVDEDSSYTIFVNILKEKHRA